MMRRRGMGRAGRPGLVGTVARTAVIAGTATAVSNKVSGHQNARAEEKAQAQEYQQQQYAAPPPQQYAQPPQQYAQPPQQYAPPQPEYTTAPAPPGGDELLDKLQQLGDLKDRGLLTQAEFDAQKARLLGG